METIGLTEQKAGLYHLLLPSDSSHVASTICSSSSSSSCSSFSVNNLWHCRLGHISFPMLKVLHQNNPEISISASVPCTVCPLAKQCKLPFPSSTHTSKLPFDLIHCDVWGPLSTPTMNRS